MNNPSVNSVAILKRQFDPSFEMLCRIVEQCPEEVWHKEEVGSPFWQQVYHTTYWVDFWLREEYRQAEFRSLIFTKDVSFELDKVSRECLTQDESKEYLGRVQEKLGRFFEMLDDDKLRSPIVEWSGFTYLDAIISQIRHVQYHVGQCNTILGFGGLKAVEWVAYNENQ